MRRVSYIQLFEIIMYRETTVIFMYAYRWNRREMKREHEEEKARGDEDTWRTDNNIR